MLHRARSLALVLALGVPVVAHAKKQNPIAAFLQQDKYTYCDAKVLAALWKVSVDDAKANVGRKLSDEKYLSTQLTNARANAKNRIAKGEKGTRCSFAEAGLTYEDAQKLAKLWKTTESNAKVMAEDKILAGGEKGLRQILGQGGATDTPTTAFLNQDKYSYCDAKVLSGMWKSSVEDAKARIGAKLQANATKYLDNELAKARKAPKTKCTYVDAGLAFDDIEKLAKLWKMSVGKAKAQAGQKATMYGTAVLKQALGASQANDDAFMTFVDQDKYTYCDAAMIASMWKQSVMEGKTLIGLKIQTKNTAALDKILADARAAAKKKPVDGCK